MEVYNFFKIFLADRDNKIVRQAIEHPPALSNKLSTVIVPRIVDQFADENATELQINNNFMSLIALAKINPIETLRCIFEKISFYFSDDEPRQRCSKFLRTKFITLGSAVITADVEKAMFEHVVSAYSEYACGLCNMPVDFDEFMPLLAGTKLVCTAKGTVRFTQIIFDCIVAEGLSEYDDELSAAYYDCIFAGRKFFPSQVQGTKYFAFMKKYVTKSSAFRNMIREKEEKIQRRN